MGLYDRSYYRDENRPAWLSGRSMVVNLMLLNGAVYLAQILFGDGVTRALALRSNLLSEPWYFWELLTYGFIHDPDSILHILFNMFWLWLFGTEVEQIYGRAEFLRFYLVTIVAAGLVWLAVQVAQGVPAVQEIPAIDGAPAMQGVVVVENVGARLLGASGGVMGVMILFVLHFPRRMFYIWGIIPLPAWALGAICVLSDLLGARNQSGDVAHVAHLAGVAFGATYYLTGLNLGRLVPQRFGSRLFRMRPSLRIHDPQQDARNLSEKVDEILEKISQQGESSLTKQERRTLEEASRRYQRRRE